MGTDRCGRRDSSVRGGPLPLWLVVYAGGTPPTQQDFTKQAFLSRFPDMKLTMVVDYSKFHDVRIDNQLATRTLVPDVVQLQTLQDFTRWKRAGVLRPYKPAGFAAVHDGLKDPDGAWVAIAVIAFSYMYNVARLAAPDVQFARGSHSPGGAVAANQKAIGIGGAWTDSRALWPTAPRSSAGSRPSRSTSARSRERPRRARSACTPAASPHHQGVLHVVRTT